MREVDKIVLHHFTCENTFQQIKNFHINARGWNDIFYHYIIEKDGAIKEGKNIKNMANRNRPNAIEICIVGRLHKREIHRKQHESLLLLIKYIHDKYGLIEILEHNDFSAVPRPTILEVEKYNNYILYLYLEEEEEELGIEDRLIKLEDRLIKLENKIKITEEQLLKLQEGAKNKKWKA